MPNERLFPIQSQRGAKPHPLQIPWDIAQLAYSVYSSRYGRSQSLERLAERGGFGPCEMDEFLPDWREQCAKRLELRIVVQLLLDQIESDPRTTQWFDARIIERAKLALK
jgi:hypothetical protein